MDHIDWIILQRINEETSISKLASKLFVTQPAISYRLAKMEEEYKIPLFIRSNRGLALTDAGKRLYSYSHKMLMLEEEIQSSVTSGTKALRGTITLGCVSSFFNAYLADYMKEFSEMYEQISFEVQLNHTPILYQNLISNNLPMIIARGRDFSEWIGEKIEISTENAIAIANEPITDEFIARTPYITTFIENKAIGNGFKSIAEEWVLLRTGSLLQLSPIKIWGNTVNLANLVKRGMGWTVVTSSLLQRVNGLYYREILDGDDQPIPYITALLYQRELETYDVYKAFLDFFRSKY